MIQDRAFGEVDRQRPFSKAALGKLPGERMGTHADFPERLDAALDDTTKDYKHKDCIYNLRYNTGRWRSRQTTFFKGSTGETSGRKGRVYVNFPECFDAILN